MCMVPGRPLLLPTPSEAEEQGFPLPASARSLARSLSLFFGLVSISLSLPFARAGVGVTPQPRAHECRRHLALPHADGPAERAQHPPVSKAVSRRNIRASHSQYSRLTGIVALAHRQLSHRRCAGQCRKLSSFKLFSVDAACFLQTKSARHCQALFDHAIHPRSLACSPKSNENRKSHTTKMPAQCRPGHLSMQASGKACEFRCQRRRILGFGTPDKGHACCRQQSWHGRTCK